MSTQTIEPVQMTEKPPSTKSNRGMWIVAGLLAICAAVGYFYWKNSQAWESTDDAQIDGRIHDISSRVLGTVMAVKVEDNQYVEAGTVLVEMDQRPYQSAVHQVEAELSQVQADAAASRSDVPVVSNATSSELSGAQASLEEVKAAIATSQQQVQAAQARLPVMQAQVREAEANSAKTASDLERYQKLVAKEEISRQQFDAATAAAATAKARLDASRGELQQAQSAVDVAQRQVTQQQMRMAKAESDVKSAASGPQQVAASEARALAAAAKIRTKQAELDQSKLNLDFTVIKAPISGIVRRNVEVGQDVQAGQSVITIVPLEDIWVTANFKENQLAQIRPGQPVEIDVDAYGGRKYSGHVDSISPATGARFSILPPENATGNFVKVVQRLAVKITFDKGQDPDHLLRPGMSVSPKVRVK